MAVKPSAASLPWFWIIELLSSCKDLDTSLLNELIFRTPNILDPLAKNARERVTLRCLEGLFCATTSMDVFPALNSKKECNLSEDCEEVIKRMDCTIPMSTSDIRMAANLEPFIKHKRVSLPPCALQQLKDKTSRRVVDVSSSDTEMGVVGEDLLIRSIPDIGNSNLLEDPKIRNSMPLKRDKNAFVGEDIHPITKKLKGNSSVPSVSIGMDEAPLDVDQLLEEPSERATQNARLKKIETVGFINNEARIEREESIDQCIVFNTSSDSSAEYRNAEYEISRKKAIFFSESQCTLESDEFTEGNICMKCNKRGQVLICSACPLAVHERCLGIVPCFTQQGSFLCPFCDYSRAVSEYLEFKKKTSCARKDLSAFISGARIHPAKRNPSKRLQKNISRKNQLREEGNNHAINNAIGDEQNRVGDFINGAPGDPQDQCVSQKGQFDGEMKERFLENDGEFSYCVDKQLSCTEEKIALIRKTLSDVNEGEGEDIDVEMVEETEERELQRDSNSKVDCQVKEELQCVSDPIETMTNDSEEISEEEHDIVTTFPYSMRARKQKKHYTYPAIPLLRRRKIPWTPDEEEALKEGVLRFCNPHDKSVPWKMILEFGDSVFLKGRTAIDLKDKWRNMCKKFLK